MEYITTENIAIFLGALWGLSEALSLIPAIKANGVFQLIGNIIRALLPEKKTI